MPTNVLEQSYIGYCGCTLPSIARACQNCLYCTTHCSCATCDRCGFRTFAEEICPTCNGCMERGCCTCFECARCSTRQTAATCDNCNGCESCCRCYRCTTCNQSFRERNQRGNFHSACNRCMEHCVCYTCRTCRVGTNSRNFCPTCSRCHAHCACTVCRCARRTSPEHMHTSCGTGRCNQCCPCHVVGVPFRPGKFKMFNSVFSKGEFKRNTSRRHISVEMEVDSFDSRSYAKEANLAIMDWEDAVVQDGSIPHGFEINTNPTNGDLFLKHIKDITDGLKKINAQCSNACGLHIHINCKGTPKYDPTTAATLLDRDGNPIFDKHDAFTGYDLRKLVVLYNIIEPAFFELCHPRRLTSRYSVPCGAYYVAKDDLTPRKFRQNMVSQMYRAGRPLEPNREELEVSRRAGELRISGGNRPRKAQNPAFRAVGDQLKRAKGHKYESVRYKALNLHSFFMRGTVEFRHHEGTVDFDTITNYALTCATIVDQAAKMTHAEIQSLPKVSRDALLAILPSDLREYAQDKWREHERAIPRYQETVRDAWREHTAHPAR